MSDLMREEFEAWSGNKSDKEIHQRGPRVGKYKNPVMQRSWEAWQASRECLVIELPPEPEYPGEPDDAIDDSYMDEYHSSVGMRHACINFIHAAGVNTK